MNDDSEALTRSCEVGNWVPRGDAGGGRGGGGGDGGGCAGKVREDE